MLERDKELSELSRLIDAGLAGDGGMAFVEGLPGIGKTSLLAAARREALERGYTILSARGSRLELEFPFGIVRQLLDPALAVAGPERELLFAGAASLATPVFADSGPAELGSADPAFSTLHGLFWLISNLADSGPIGLLIDDLHWSDRYSLRLLAFLAHRLDGLNAFVVGASRTPTGEDTTGSQTRELLDHLRIDCGARLVKLAPLSAAATGEFVREHLGARVEDEMLPACHELTGGNPFMLTELLRELEGADSEPISAQRIRDSRPERIIEAIVTRIDRLGPDAEQLCRALAVVGDPADPDLLAEQAGLGPAKLSDLTTALTSAGVFSRSQRSVSFLHPIIRTAVYERINPAEAAAEHARAAELLRGRDAATEAVATQLLRVPPGDAGDWAIDALIDAARSALARGAPEDAAELFARAAEENVEGEARAALMLELGGVSMLAGRESAIVELEEGFAHARDPYLRAALSLNLAMVQFAAGDPLACLEALGAGLEWVDSGPTDEALAGQILSVVLGLALYAPEPRRALRERFAAMAQTVELPDPPPALLGTLAIEGAFTGKSAAEVAALAEAAVSGGIVEQLTSDGISVHHTAGALMLAGKTSRALELSETATADARRRGSSMGFSYCSLLAALAHLRAGNLAEARAEAEAVFELGDIGGSGAVMALVAGPILMQIHVEQGDLDAAQEWGERALETPIDPEMVGYQELRRALVELRLAQGRAEEARPLLERLFQWEREYGGGELWTDSRRLGALVEHKLGNHERAQDLAAEQLDAARAFGADWCLGVALMTEALVGPAERAAAGLAEAVKSLARSEYRLDHARALVEHGVALRRDGAGLEAREVLREGSELASRLGATVLAERALDELVATGARPRLESREASELTPAELRVARRAADGLTNREIAQALFVTQKTVETHLSSVYRKLEVSSRAQLPARLRGEEPA